MTPLQTLLALLAGCAAWAVAASGRVGLFVAVRLVALGLLLVTLVPLVAAWRAV